MYTPCFELWSGTPVIARDGAVGTVRHMFIHIRQRCIVALVVQRRSLFARPVIVPVTRITSASDQAIYLDISRSEVDVLPYYSARLYQSVAVRQRAGLSHARSLMTRRAAFSRPSHMLAAHMNTPHQGRFADMFRNYALIQARQKVFCRQGCAGRVAGFLITANGQVQALIIRRKLWPHVVRLPVDQLERIDQTSLCLAVERCQLNVLPPYRPDHALKVVVSDALQRTNRGGDRQHPCIDVAVHGGVVYLSGYVDQPEQRTYAEKVVRGIKGIAGVENELIVDGEVMHAVAQELAQHAWIAAEAISVYVHQGVVYLDGHVTNLAIRAAAEECAAQIPLVRGVINHLQAEGSDLPGTEDERVLQPQIGQEVFASDRLAGIVERVIINRHHRRVTACVIDTHLMQPASETDRHIVVPTRVIQNVTPGGVLLTIDSQTLNGYPLFDREDYLLPPAEWHAPYPYQPAAVLCERDDAYYSTGNIYQGKPSIVSPPRTRRRGISYRLPI